MVAAPASGQGKTTVACALARLHARRGRRVRAFKCGPDFLDPQWLALASGAPVDSLDLWLTGEADCAARLRAAAAGSDLVVVESVMGLFDGHPDAADLARRFGLPVLLVVDASAMAGTFGAVVHGLQTYREGLREGGVLANRAAGERHADMLQAALRSPRQWMGWLPHDPRFAMPERHLGVVAAAEVGDATARVDAAADALARTPLGALDLVAWSVQFDAPAVPAVRPLLAGRTIAVARDAAFCFLYPANLKTLQALGAQLSFFSPLAGDPLPDCDAVWLPGGYPELHAHALSSRLLLAQSIRAHVDAGRPVWAECGGMMVLAERLVDVQGQAHAMWGLLPGTVAMGRRLAALGPQSLELPQGTLRGHTFHHSRFETGMQPAGFALTPVGAVGEALWRAGSLRASYVHAWFASSPEATAALFTQEAA